MAALINWNTKSFDQGIKNLVVATAKQSRLALIEIADEVLRLSGLEVPHDTGALQNSGVVQSDLTSPDTVIVGYNKVYAARLHEHPEYKFQKGRKGKYLEDPIKLNLTIFREYYAKSMRSIFK